ncbi:alpha/beta hydrolase [Nocardioides sp. JQ2195]|uniref:alpha/beta hydrolase n=1 Tax=Nocardioides sp. JQ2195 TaxID=2592334 RepID=UPI00143E5CA3|nr:alpha/beta hydrolase [Nocardioides sp. JQ2195]QIX28740.1 alpha/beta hydrolase [Nocardioides sp. JQ2195]
MTCEEGRLAGALGESYWQAWLPESTPKAVVLVVHGVAEHSGRYAGLAARLVDAGYAVYALDNHGHGRSAGTPGNIGRMGALVADVHALRGMAEAARPGVPVFIIGHSLGALLSLDYLVTQGQAGISGVVLSGAAIDPSIGSRLERLAAPLLSRLLPNLALVNLGIDNICRDPEVVEAYRADPLVYTGKVRARTGAEVLVAIDRVSAGLPALTLPALVLHGGDDRLADPAGAQLIHDAIGSTDKTQKIYDGLYHEIFNEPEKDQVLADVVTWLDAH